MERNMSLSMKDRRQQKNHIAMRNPNQISSNANNYNVNNPKDHHYSWNHHHVFKNNQSYEDQDYLINGFSWPPRSYTCSFCNREFRSAQALGGHMNVHRKDRARLRQSPPRVDNGGRYGTTAFLNLNLNSNPNPNFSSSLSSSSPSLITSPLSSLASPPLSSLSSSSPIYSTFFPNNNINSYYENKKLPWTSVDQSLDPLTVNGLDLAITMKNKQSANCGPGEQHNYGFAGKSIYCNSLNNGADHQTTTTVRLDLEIGLLGADSKMGRNLDLELRLGYSN